MKALIMSLGLLVSQASFAAPPMPGAPTDHDLGCSSVRHLLGVSYGLIVTTQALAPQYNVRGITLLRHVVAPGAKPQSRALHQVRQDVHSATFAAGNVRVVLDKASFSANIYMSNQLEYLCK